MFVVATWPVIVLKAVLCGLQHYICFGWGGSLWGETNELFVKDTKGFFLLQSGTSRFYEGI